MKQYRPVWFGLALAALMAVFASVPLGSQSNWYYLPGQWNDGLWVDKPARIDTLTARHQLFPPSYSTLPTCDTDTEPAILFDTSDNLWKGCSDQSGSFEWTPLGGDVDQDGFVGVGPNAIDADDNDNAVFARNLTAANVRSGTEIGPNGDVILTGTLRYEETTTYSGTDAQVDPGAGSGYLTGGNDDQRRCAAIVLCREKGDLSVSSFTQSFVSPPQPHYLISSNGLTCNTAPTLSRYLVGVDNLNPGGRVTTVSRTLITGATCVGTRGS